MCSSDLDPLALILRPVGLRGILKHGDTLRRGDVEDRVHIRRVAEYVNEIGRASCRERV